MAADSILEATCPFLTQGFGINLLAVIGTEWHNIISARLLQLAKISSYSFNCNASVLKCQHSGRDPSANALRQPHPLHGRLWEVALSQFPSAQGVRHRSRQHRNGPQIVLPSDRVPQALQACRVQSGRPPCHLSAETAALETRPAPMPHSIRAPEQDQRMQRRFHERVLDEGYAAPTASSRM